MASLPSSYRAKNGVITSEIAVAPPSAGGDISSAQVGDVTFEPNQLLDFSFTALHAVPRAGFLKVRFPPGTFTFNAAATAVA
jgi:hypothetical protein